MFAFMLAATQTVGQCDRSALIGIGLVLIVLAGSVIAALRTVSMEEVRKEEASR